MLFAMVLSQILGHGFPCYIHTQTKIYYRQEVVKAVVAQCRVGVESVVDLRVSCLWRCMRSPCYVFPLELGIQNI